MTISLSDPLIWKIAASIIGVGAAAYRFRRFLVAADGRGDIVVDGWVTRFMDDPSAYRSEERRLKSEHRKDIVFAISIVAFEIAVWGYL